MATTTEKVKFESLLTATVKANNSNDNDRVYSIESEVSVRGSSVESVSSGQVNEIEGNVPLASFSMYSGSGLNVNFYESAEESKQCGILNAINTFITDVKTTVSTTPSINANI